MVNNHNKILRTFRKILLNLEPHHNLKSFLINRIQILQEKRRHLNLKYLAINIIWIKLSLHRFVCFAINK